MLRAGSEKVGECVWTENVAALNDLDSAAKNETSWGWNTEKNQTRIAGHRGHPQS